MNVFPVYLEIDEKDPERAYNAVRGKNTYLLESSEGGEKIARYSFIGFNPVAVARFQNDEVECEVFDPQLKLEFQGSNPLELMRGLMGQFVLKEKPMARFFGGFVGYFSYDLVRHFIKLDDRSDDLKEPDCEFVLCKNNMIFDHKINRTYLTSNQFLSPEDVDIETVKRGLGEIASDISNNGGVDDVDIEHRGHTSNQTRKEFMENVKTAKGYIREGDIFQVVLSQRLQSSYDGDKFLVYRALKRINPSPYMYYLDFGDRKIVGSSPEMLVRVEKRRVETYPIAGTRPRGKDEEEDKKLEDEMLADEKENAEHVMLVDLGRNDIGRVARYGTVNVTKFMETEKYSHVQHMVSEVIGLLREDKDRFDALKSVFPAGTVSGAPKVRAMEIIDELEPTRRGIYSGCVGYFSFTNAMDTAITIRTIVFEKDKAFIQVGAGVVADSKPENEYLETLNKGGALLKALGG